MAKKQFKKKLPEGVTEDFIQEIDSSSSEELKTRIVQYETGIDEAQTWLKSDPGVLDLKEAYDQAAGPTRDAIKALRNKKRVVLDALKKVGA